MTSSQTFTLPGATSILCPGAYLSAAGRAVLATGFIDRIIVNPDAAATLTIGVYDAFDANGVTFRSTGRIKREIDLTGAAALRQSVFELVGTGITGGPSLSTYNRKAEFSVPPESYDLGGGAQFGGGQVELDVGALCNHGMIVLVDGVTGGASVSVIYRPLTLGRYHWVRTANPVSAF